VKRCAYLTMADPADFVMDYDLSFESMARLGWRAEPVVWNDPGVDWDAYDVVYICTPWDYTDDAEHFIAVLETIDRSRAVLMNDLSLVRWNLAKTYLRELESKGVAVVPSRWFDRFAAVPFVELFAEFDAGKLVVKPQVGCNAEDTFVLDAPPSGRLGETLRETFAERPLFVQPFLPHILDEGEYSVILFGGSCSHAILKTPKAGDFRSQEEHGAEITSVDPSPALVAAAERALASVTPVPVYGRADFVRDDADVFRLMELEIIEPSLYFRTAAGSADRFAAAIEQRFQERTGK
jgi:glutathione synthase/RimK-type ligase-like ATP-grasp enzyme